MSRYFPDAPWHTHGRAFLQPYLVSTADLRLPAGFAATTVAGRAIGMLAFIEYVSPSPIEYRELAWLPCLVSSRGRRGAWIEKMYVDSEPSLEGGRSIWNIPKQLARFEVRDREVRIETEDGARLVLDVASRGPAVRTKVGAATLQPGIRFRFRGTARVASGAITLREATGLEGWGAFPTAHRFRGAGAALHDFAITMHEPRVL